MTETRAEKAQRLVDEGRVVITIATSMFTAAIVHGDHRAHATNTYACGHFFCTCPWGNVHSYTDDLCAHALALRLAIEKEN